MKKLRRRSTYATKERGSILIFTTWLLVILGIFSTAVGYQVRQRLRYIQTLEIREKLRAAADAGVQKALQIVMMTGSSGNDNHRSRWADSPTDFKEIELGDARFTVSYPSDNGEIRYGIKDEESKINLNKTKSIKEIARIFELAADIGETQADEIAASILDWIDEDDSVNANGAEARHYWMQKQAYSPKNAELDSFEELLLVKGVTPDIYVKVLPSITLHSSGKVNLNTASSKVIQAKGLDKKTADAVIEYRAGRDRKEGTEDDRFFSVREGMAEDFSGAVSLSVAEVEKLTDLVESGEFTIKSTEFEVYSTANLNYRKEKLTLSCNISRVGVINYCKEFYGRIDFEPPTAENREFK